MAPFRGTTGTKGSFSTSGHDPEGVVKWGIWWRRERDVKVVMTELQHAQNSFQLAPSLLWGGHFSAPSLLLSLHTGVRERTQGGQGSNWAFRPHKCCWTNGGEVDDAKALIKEQLILLGGKRQEAGKEPLAEKTPVPSGVKWQGAA